MHFFVFKIRNLGVEAVFLCNGLVSLYRDVVKKAAPVQIFKTIGRYVCCICVYGCKSLVSCCNYAIAFYIDATEVALHEFTAQKADKQLVFLDMQLT